ncbi:hypothetical protein [Streptomyces sp. NPDC056192]|uniref:hypothetical protein n=1 Tax=Streptomyces sp. NPDC056192 TaxID=3345743 RepID=UPI0035DA53FE
MSELIAACTPNSYPNEDGRVVHGYQLTVLDQDIAVLASTDLPGWESFHPEAAGKHLADMGFTLQSDPSSPDADSWSPAGLGYMATVTRTHSASTPTSVGIMGIPSDDGSGDGWHDAPNLDGMPLYPDDPTMY